MAIRLLDKEKILTILHNRPALLRSMKKPDDAFTAKCIMATSNADFMDSTWLTLPVLEALIPLLLEETYYRGSYRLPKFPLEVRNALPLNLLTKICKAHSEAVEHFPMAPYKIWLKRATEKNEGHLDFDKIPVQHRTEELLAGFFVEHHDQSASEIPDELFTDSLADKILIKDPDCLSVLPDKFINSTRLERALALKPTLELKKAIPVTAWTQELAERAMGDEGNISYIPHSLKTKEMCLKAVLFSETLLNYVPKDLRDEDIYLAAFTTDDSYYFRDLGEEIPKKILTKAFLLKLAAMDRKRFDESDNLSKKSAGVLRYKSLKTIEDKDWVEVIKIHPIALGLVERTNQTDEMIDALIENATMDMIDSLMRGGKINLSKIKIKHCPLLIATSNQTLQGIIQRKMAPQARVKKVVPDALSESAPVITDQSGSIPEDKVALDLTDGEFLELSNKFKL